LAHFGVRLGGATVLEDINLHVHCGELTAIIGPNGAGKTTLFRAMLGELPHGGDLQFVHAGSGQQFGRPRIGYVPQKMDLDGSAPATVRDLFASVSQRRPLWLGLGARHRAEARDALGLVEAQHLLDQTLGALSGGELQRVLLALALHPLPDLLLLDEPVSGVDQAGMELFYRMVSRLRLNLDLSILLVSHDLAAIARVADRMIFLNHRILADGTPAEVLAGPLVKQVFGMEFSGREPGFVQHLPEHIACPWPQPEARHE
jgi:zinc transport system ATP-binding protein